MIPIAGDSTPTSFVDLLRRRARQAPARRAFLFLRDGEAEQGALTYAELDRRARAIGAALQAAHAGGARALLLIPPGLDYIAAFFGCLYAGVVAVPAYPPKHNRNMLRLQAIVADARATIALTTAQVASRSRRISTRRPAWPVCAGWPSMISRTMVPSAGRNVRLPPKGWPFCNILPARLPHPRA